MSRSVLTWKAESGMYTVEFDAVELEAPSHAVAITEYPVERGASLVDHIRMRPTTLRMTAHVSNNPVREITSQMDGIVPVTSHELRVRKPLIPAANTAKLPASIAGIPLSYETTVRAKVRTWGSTYHPVRRVQNVYAELQNAMREGRVFTVVSDLGDYDNMVLRSLQLERDVVRANAPRFELDFQQVMFAELTFRDVLADVQPKKPASLPKKDKGKDQAKKADAESESVGHAITGDLTDLFDFL